MKVAYLHVIGQITQNLILQGNLAFAVLVSVECHDSLPHSIIDIVGVESVLYARTDDIANCFTDK